MISELTGSRRSIADFRHFTVPSSVSPSLRVSGSTSLSPTRRAEFDAGGEPLLQEIAEHRQQFLDAMDDDFNTGGAIGELFEVVHALNRLGNQITPGSPTSATGQLADYRKGMVVLKELSQILGLFRRPIAVDQTVADTLTAPLLSLLIDLRARLRKEKNFSLADEIRNRLTELGVTLEDRPDSTRWRIEPRR